MLPADPDNWHRGGGIHLRPGVGLPRSPWDTPVAPQEEGERSAVPKQGQHYRMIESNLIPYCLEEEMACSMERMDTIPHQIVCLYGALVVLYLSLS